MTRQAHNPLGRMLNPFKTVLFISALLMFVFTVIYRMLKSASFSNAVATLVESLLIVFFFIFLGILGAYLLYFIYQRVRRESRRQRAHSMFDFHSDHQEPACKPDSGTLGFAPDDETKSSPDSI